ncbi:hypothetical protein LTR66_017921, partial [Elasticomyces elasticus]
RFDKEEVVRGYAVVVLVLDVIGLRTVFLVVVGLVLPPLNVLLVDVLSLLTVPMVLDVAVRATLGLSDVMVVDDRARDNLLGLADMPSVLDSLSLLAPLTELRLDCGLWLVMLPIVLTGFLAEAARVGRAGAWLRVEDDFVAEAAVGFVKVDARGVALLCNIGRRTLVVLERNALASVPAVARDVGLSMLVRK